MFRSTARAPGQSSTESYDILLVPGADHIPDGVVVHTLESFDVSVTSDCVKGAGAYWSTGDTVRLCGGDLLSRAFAFIVTALAAVVIVV